MPDSMTSYDSVSPTSESSELAADAEVHAVANKNGDPKYIHLAEAIKRQISSGALRPGDRLPSFASVRSQGLGQHTLEKAHSLLESEGLIRRVKGSGVFVAEPNRPAATGLIGFVGGTTLSRRSNYWTQILEGVENAARQRQERILLLDPESPSGWDKVDGVLLCEVLFSRVRHWLPAHVPCTSLVLPVEGTSSVVPDNFNGAKKAVEHLLELGHRRIGCLMRTAYLIPRLRIAGYRDALQAAGIDPEPSWIHNAYVDNEEAIDSHEAGVKHMREWLNSGWVNHPCTAILVQNDDMAMGAIEALRERGLRVPNDVSVVSFDNIEIAAYYSPPLTTVALPLTQIGVTGIDVLYRQIKGDAHRTETVVLPVDLKIRQSSAPPRAA